jgi:fimbrial isopeptide formation D2 family protein/LPXTG-motif cell wall-anchored protein
MSGKEELARRRIIRIRPLPDPLQSSLIEREETKRKKKDKKERNRNEMKKLFNKIVSAVVALTMLTAGLALCASAETGAEPASATEKNHTYELYQIFKGDFGGEKLSNITWGKNGIGTEDEAVGSETLTALSNVTDDSKNSDSAQLAVIKNYVNLNSTAYRGGDQQPEKDADSNGYTYTDIEPGYYLIKDKDNSQTGEGSYYTLYVVKSTSGTLFFEPKGSVPDITKKVYEDGGWYAANSASIGEDVKYQITGTVSSRISEFATYYYKFTDTLSSGLTYKDDSLKVYLVNGTSKVDVTSCFWVSIGEYSETNGTSITVAISDLKALVHTADVDTLDGNSTVVVEYTAVLNENALIKDPNNNDVKIVYSNDPNNSGTPTECPPGTPKEEPEPQYPTGETVTATTQTFTTSLVIKKVDDAKEILTGAEFTLTGDGVKQVLVTELTFVEDENGTYYKLKDGTYTMVAPVTAEDATNTTDRYASIDTKYEKSTVINLKGEGQTETTVKGEVDENGIVTFTGLGAGEYTLSETKTPAGYNTMENITFKITFDKDSKTFSANRDDLVFDAAKGEFNTSIINHAGSSLPHTGGIGTTIFYALGTALVLGSAVLLIVKRRMKNEA